MNIQDLVVVPLFIVILLGTSTLLWRSYIYKDISILGVVIPRIYLLGVLVMLEFGMPVEWWFIHIGVLLTMLSDLIVNAFRIKSKKFKDKIDDNKLIETLRDLNYKYSIVVENNPVGLFTTSLEGVVEYSNPAFITLWGSDLLGKNIFELLCPKGNKITKILALKDKETLVYSNLSVQTDLGTKKVNLLIVRTRNGHETITGSIQEV